MPIPLTADDPSDALLPDQLYAPSRDGDVRVPVIEVRIETGRPRIELRLRADRDDLPIARQALRAIARATGVDPNDLQDAELAVTEAASNVVRHAYPDGDGDYELTLEARPPELVAVVRDSGRGMGEAPTAGDDPTEPGGLGLAMIESVARDVRIRSDDGAGTEITMALAGADSVPDEAAGGLIAEHVVRQLVAMAAAQADLPPARLTEALLAVEMIVQHAVHHLHGEVLEVGLRRPDQGVELLVGPLADQGAAALLRDAELPPLGSVVERFASGLSTVPGDDGCERLVARFDA